MRPTNRGLVLTNEPGVRAAFEQVSKAALMDLVVDLLRRSQGEALEGAELDAVLREALAPVLLARGDRPLGRGK